MKVAASSVLGKRKMEEDHPLSRSSSFSLSSYISSSSVSSSFFSSSSSSSSFSSSSLVDHLPYVPLLREYVEIKTAKQIQSEKDDFTWKKYVQTLYIWRKRIT